MSIIAIFSRVYSAGDEIARQIASRLDYKFVGDELLEEAAKTYNTSVEKLARAMGKRAFLNSVTRDSEKHIVYVKAALARLLTEDNVVYFGPATHLVPSDISHILKVGVIADSEFRIKRGVEQTKKDPEQVVQEIKKSDRHIAEWIKFLSDSSPWDSSLYDIKIPLPQTSLSGAVELICENISKNVLQPTEQSIQTALDFQFATRINLALLEKGHYYCDVTANKEKITVVINKNKSASGTFIKAIRALRYEQAEDEVRKICLGFKNVKEVVTTPGKGYKRYSRALLVDDEKEFVLTLSQRLETREISSDVVHNGEQALSAVDGDEPDVMVLDLRMPGIDGIEVLRKVKREHPKMEVIILTGHGSKQDEQVAKALGAFAFLTKPVDIEVLAETMKRASKKAHRE